MFRSKATRKSDKVKKKRWRRRVLAVILLVVTTITAVLLLSPAPFIELAATRVLAAQGLVPASLRVERADWRVFIVHDLVLGSGPDLSIGELRLDYVLSELVLGRVRKITLDDVRVLAKVLDDQTAPATAPILSFGVLDQLVSHIALGTGPDEGPLSELTLSNGLFRVETPVGSVDMTFGVTRTRQNVTNAFVQLQQGEVHDEPEELDVARLEGQWHQSAAGVQEARFNLSLRRLASEGLEIEDARFTLRYEGDEQGANGEVTLNMPAIALSNERRRALQSFLPDDVRDALGAPMAAAFADRFSTVFGDLAEAAELNGRLLITRDKDGFAFTFDEPLVLAKAPFMEQSPASSLRLRNQVQPVVDQSALHVSVGNVDDQQPFLAFHLAEDWRLDFASKAMIQGGGLPEFDARFFGQVGAPSPTQRGTTLVSTSLSPRRHPVLVRVLIDLAPWSEGGFTIGVKGLDLSLEGNLGKFSGRMIGEIFLDGSPVEEVNLVGGQLGLAGSFERNHSGFFYTQASDSCMVLKSEKMQITSIKFERPILSLCPDEGEPLLHALFGKGRPTEIQMNATIPSEETRVVFDSGLGVGGDFPKINLYTEYIMSTQQWRLTYGLYDGSLALGSEVTLIEGLKLSGIASGVAEKLEQATVTLDQMVLRDALELPRFAPVRLIGKLELNEGEAFYTALATDQGGRTMAEFEGEYDRQKKEGQLEGKTPLLSFMPAGFQPQDWLPVLKGVVAEVEGTASAEMLVQWGEDHLESSAHVTLTELKLATSIGPMVGINSEIVFSSLLPPVTQKPQIIHIREIDIGTDLLFGMLSFSVSSDGRIYLENAEWPWAGGLIGVERTELYFDDRAQGLVLTAQDIDLEEVFTLLDVDGLKGTGILAGKLPASISKGTIEIMDGQLTSSQEGGTLKYIGSASQAASQEEGSSLLFNALQDFHYDKLNVSINGRTTDILTVSIALIGYNPSVMEGYPIKLNINTEGPLVEMIRQGTIGYRVPSQIRQKLNQNTR